MCVITFYFFQNFEQKIKEPIIRKVFIDFSWQRKFFQKNKKKFFHIDNFENKTGCKQFS